MKETQSKPEHDNRPELISMGLDEEFVNFLNTSDVESFAKALTNKSSYISASSLHHALSVFDDEAYATILYILETNFGIRTNGQSPSTLSELEKALESLFGSASSIITARIEDAMKPG